MTSFPLVVSPTIDNSAAASLESACIASALLEQFKLEIEHWKTVVRKRSGNPTCG